jgi:hypothetical protein
MSESGDSATSGDCRSRSIDRFQYWGAEELPQTVLSSKGPAVHGVGGTGPSGANDMAIGDRGETHGTGELWKQLYDAMRSLD